MSIRHYITLVENSNRHPLEWFGDEENYDIRKGDHDEPLDPNDSDLDEPARFGSGGQWFICTDWSEYVRRAYGARAKLYGFHHEDGDNFAPGLDERGFDGHDFAVVDDRYIVDGWLKNIEGFHHSAVIDMHDPGQHPLIAEFYGDPKLWERNEGLEHAIDKETPQQRADALRGMKPFPKF